MMYMALPNCCCYCFLEQEAIVYSAVKWRSSGLVSTGGSSPPSCNIIGYLVLTGIAIPAVSHSV